MFIDDIPVSSQGLRDHEDHLQIVLWTSHEHKLYAKLSKCEFWLDQVVFLSHVVSRDGVKDNAIHHDRRKLVF